MIGKPDYGWDQSICNGKLKEYNRKNISVRKGLIKTMGIRLAIWKIVVPGLG